MVKEVIKSLLLVWCCTLFNLETIYSQCTSTFGSYLVYPCNTDTALIPKPTPVTVEGCGDVTSVQAVLPFQTIMNGCDSTCFSLVLRQWLIMIDGEPNQLLNDTICFTSVDLDDIVCPNDTLVYCNSGLSLDTTVAALGSPLHHQGIPCNILQSGPTQIIWFSGATGCLKFTRQWLIMDWCNPGRIDTCRQTIEIRDTIDPSIVVASSLPDASTTGDACTANVNFPPAAISDNCASNSQITVKIVIAGQTIYTNGGLITNIPQGNHMAIYTASDGCGNTSSDTSLITVKDNIGPVAICKSAKTIQLGQAGMLTMPASAFDDGSFDLCYPFTTVKVRRLPWSSFCGLTDSSINRFDDLVKFCCEDANKDIMVIVRVYQGLIQPGPISLDAYGVYTDCMVMVKVLDKAGPVISCPLDTTIECRDISKKSVKSLTAYGAAIVSDMCLDSVWVDSLPALNQCQTGKIIRRINAKDEAGNISFCNQTIYVVNSDPFDGYDSTDIAWPKDTTFFICSANTGTSVTGVPVVLDPACSQLVFKSEDEVYSYAPSACKKILRRWTATDWCQLSDINHKAGKWYYTQKIIVMDTIKPVLSVPGNFIVNNMDSTCGSVLVNVPLPSAVDCTPFADLGWSYVLDLFNDGQNLIPGNTQNASQNMPNGIHKLEFKVADQCGNTTTGITMITVKDAKKPTAVVMHGIATDLSLMNGTAMARVHAKFFFVSSTFDNCTPFNKLKFSFSPSLGDSLRVYTCDSIGTRLVKLYITDEAGNQDWVNSYIIIQNNMGACTGPSPASGLRTTAIDGKIKTEWGSLIEQVGIKLMHGEEAMPEMMSNGKYTIRDLYMGQSYQIIPKKDVNPLNGVSTLDLIMIQKHILGAQLFQTPYKLIAADIDKNGEINGVDLVELRKLILGVDKSFTKNESWRFVDAGYRFIDKNQALKETFNEFYLIKNLQQPMQIDFVGVKIGDVNESSITTELQRLEERNATPFKPLYAINAEYHTDELIKVNVFAEGPYELQGFQFELRSDDLEYLGMEGGIVQVENVFINDLKEGLRFSFHHNKPILIFENKPMLTLLFKARRSGSLKNSIHINQNGLNPEWYDGELKTYRLGLNWKEKTSEASFQNVLNRPNPFFNETTIQFQLPGPSPVLLKVINLNGSLIYQKQLNGLAGINEWTISRNLFNASGIYYYKLESLFGTTTRKMILLN